MKNPPAFPRTGVGNAGVGYDVPSQDGMTIRDYFAAKAMAAMIPDRDRSGNRIWDEKCSWIADLSYDIADAMLAEREKSQ